MIPATEVEYWASLGNVTKVRQAIADGHDVNVHGESGYTALHAAAEKGHLEVIRVLLDCGALADARLDSGETPVDPAVMAGKDDAAGILLDRKKVCSSPPGATSLSYH